MSPATLPRLVLELPPDQSFLPTAAAAAENAAQAFGLDRNAALRLALAVEELFAYLCRHAGREDPIRLTLAHGGTFARASFRFRAGEVSLRALNFAAGVELGTAGHCDGHEQGLAELGLLVASRTADRCSLELCGGDAYQLCAEVDRQYPEAEPVATPQTLVPPLKIVEAPDAGLLQHCALLAAGRYAPRLLPKSFQRPARFADMCACGQYKALAAVDAAGRPAGLICWRASGRRGVAFSGPYIFAREEDGALRQDSAKLLTERFLSLVARTEAASAFSERPTADLPRGWFEALGNLTIDGEEQPAFFRHLREDVGAAVWAAPALVPFLNAEYDRLAFSRDLLPAPEADPARQIAHSLLATSIDRQRGIALLRPLLDGRDFAANLAAHVAALRQEDPAPSVLLHLDLSKPWQGALFPLLVAQGFAPRILLPHGGDSDVLVCQHVPDCQHVAPAV